MKFIAKTLQGLETVLAEELKSLGATNIEEMKRAVAFEGDKETLYRVNYLSRLALRILFPIKTFMAENELELYQEINNIRWENTFDLDQTFAVQSTVNSRVFTHSKYAALKTKDAIVDRYRDNFGRRPNVNPLRPDIGIDLHIYEKRITVSLDASGESLHRRGYRINSVEAPLNEVLAAGLLALSKWDKKSPLLDPMCGSGTLVIEAAMMARNMPPRHKDFHYGFMNWKNYDEELWNKVKTESKPLSVNVQIEGQDNMLSAVKGSQINAEEAGVVDFISFSRQDFFKSDNLKSKTIIFNPPYDIRLKDDDIVAFYKLIGDKMKRDANESFVYIISGAIPALKQLGLKPDRKYRLDNGGIESSFNKYEIYDGSRRLSKKY